MAEKIIYINLGGIGDILLSIPALRAIKIAKPQVELHLLINQAAKEAIKIIPFVDQYHLLTLKSPLNNIFTLIKLRKESFDTAINARSLVSKSSAIKVHWLLSMINAKKTVGWNTAGRGYFFNIKIEEPAIMNRHELQCHIDTVRTLNIDVPDTNINLPINRIRLDEISRKFNILPNDTIIGIHPGGKASHQWPAENFALLINSLREKIKVKFIITGASNEKLIAKKINSITGNTAIDLSGELDLNDLFTMIKRCDLYISNDTGPMHIAAIMKRPLIAIFGPGYLTQYDPRAISPEAIVICTTASCAPCNKTKCRKLDCLKNISVQDVTNAAIKLLKQ